MTISDKKLLEIQELKSELLGLLFAVEEHINDTAMNPEELKALKEVFDLLDLADDKMAVFS